MPFQMTMVLNKFLIEMVSALCCNWASSCFIVAYILRTRKTLWCPRSSATSALPARTIGSHSRCSHSPRSTRKPTVPFNHSSQNARLLIAHHLAVNVAYISSVDFTLTRHFLSHFIMCFIISNVIIELVMCWNCSPSTLLYWCHFV